MEFGGDSYRRHDFSGREDFSFGGGKKRRDTRRTINSTPLVINALDVRRRPPSRTKPLRGRVGSRGKGG